jgi:lipopolysaccharide transport system permease protein
MLHSTFGRSVRGLNGGFAAMWNGNYYFVIRKLVLKDFKVRYRNMSLGVLWSLVNPLVMMALLTFVFKRIFNSQQPNYPVFVFCGLLPFNFFSLAWTTGTTSIVDSAGLIKRVPVPREVIPLSAVLSCCLHLLIQIGLLLIVVILFGLGINVHWFWMPVLLILEVIFVAGLSLLTAGMNVIVRDTRYVVESINTILFWLVPIIYSLTLVPVQYQEIYQLNPLAALAVAFRNILMQGVSPAPSLILKMTLVSFCSFGAGWFAFSKVKDRFYDYL